MSIWRAPPCPQTQAPQLYANGILRPIMEFLAMDMALKAWAPRVLRPIVWIGLLLRGGPEAMCGPRAVI